MIPAPFFYSLEPREVLLAIEGYEIRKKESFFLNQTAMSNAIGLHFGKGFKPHNPFDLEEKKQKTVTIEEKETTLEFLKERFE